jgi:soluble lytic murein transglycosylase
LSSEDRLIANARIALQNPPRKGLQAIVDAVPAGRRNDPGLLWDRARYIRRSGRPEDAVSVVLQIDPMLAAASARESIAEERLLYIPRMVRNGQRREAYRLAAGHGLRSGENFADSEFRAGWIALRFLRDTAAAERHFTTLEGGVTAPVSKARALYWGGRALEAMNRDADAQVKFSEAAGFAYTYYGQLAATKLPVRPPLSFPDREPISAQARAEFESRDVVRAMRLMAEVGVQEDFESFAFYLDDQLQTPLEHELLSQMARERAYTRTAVRSAKAGLRRGIVAPDSAYPLMDIPSDARRPGRPEPALILAITRQETEFDTRAVSPAGARGLMQLMPATARATARIEGLPYQLPWLIEDPAYNVTLGAAHLEHLLDDYGGSYILTIAAYNAGPGNVRKWIEDHGDPRSGGVDAIDWVEMITFEETRNYVMRVLENVGVYRWRLANTPTPIRIDQDIRRGT